MVSLQGTSRSGSSSSWGGCQATSEPQSQKGEREGELCRPKITHLTGCYVHNKVYRPKIAGEGETILDQLEDGEPRRPHICTNRVFRPSDAFGLR